MRPCAPKQLPRAPHMIARVIEIASEGCHLARLRGLMTVTRNGVEEGRVPLDDIGVLLCNARGLTYSNGLLVELARRGVARGPVRCQLSAGGLALAARRSPHPGAADAPPARSLKAAMQAPVAGDGTSQDRSAAERAGASRLARRRLRPALPARTLRRSRKTSKRRPRGATGPSSSAASSGAAVSATAPTLSSTTATRCSGPPWPAPSPPPDCIRPSAYTTATATTPCAWLTTSWSRSRPLVDYAAVNLVERGR